MKSKIFTLVSISYLFLFVLNFAQSQTSPPIGLLQERQNTIATDHLPLTPYSNREILSYWQEVAASEAQDQGLQGGYGNGKEHEHPLMQWQGSVPAMQSGSGETVHFRGTGSRLDSSYVFVDWLGTEMPFSKIYYQYDDVDRKTKAVYTQSEPYFQILYSYNSDGNLSTEEQQYLDWNGDWYKWKLIEYGYSSMTQLLDTVVTSYRDYSAEAWVSWQMDIYTMDTQGLPKLKLTSFKDGEAGFVLDERTTYSYNNAGQILEDYIQRICFHGNTDAWRKTVKRSYSYDASGKLEERVTARWEIDYWRETERLALDYDEFGNLLREQFFFAKLSGDSSWIPTQEEDITYDPAGNKVSVTVHKKGSHQWVVQWQTDSLFDEEGKVIEIVERSGFCPPLLIAVSKKIFSYNFEGKLEEVVFYQCDLSTYEWKEWQREIYGYSEDGLLEKWTLQNIDDNDPPGWDNSYQRLFSYDSLSLLKEKTGQYWVDSQWADDGLTTYSYDSLSRQTEEVFHYWNGEIWQIYSRNTFDYDGNGNLMEIMDWVWNFDGTWNWKPGSVRFTFEYDDLGRQILEEIAYKNYDIGELLPKYRIHTQYHPITGKPIEHLTEEFKQTSYTWEWNITYHHFWNEATTPIWETADTGLECRFANPCGPNCLISCNGMAINKPTFLSIYDLMGRLRFQTRFTGETQLDGRMAAGSYFLVITSEDKVLFREKLVVL